VAGRQRLHFRQHQPEQRFPAGGETRKALDALRADPLHRQRYESFLADMVYGDKPAFEAALATVSALAETALGFHP
jgi:hypothetical protein